MAKHDVPGVDKNKVMAHVYGNKSVAYARRAFPVGVAAGDTASLLRLPQGVRILGAVASQPGAAGAALTANIGLVPVKPGEGAQLDVDYFFAALDLNKAHRTSWGNVGVEPLILDADYYVQAVFAGVTGVTAFALSLTVDYEFLGNL